MILLDTCVLIEVLRRRDKKATLFYQVVSEGFPLTISSVTDYEFRNGITPKNREICERLINGLRVLPFDFLVAQTASSIYRRLKA